jgi:hypothetical protein
MLLVCFSTQTLDYGLKIQELINQYYRVLFEVKDNVAFVLFV